jgi:hypothetical protein
MSITERERRLNELTIKNAEKLIDSEYNQALSQWLEEKFGISLWSLVDMEPETLKEILDKFQDDEVSKK